MKKDSPKSINCASQTQLLVSPVWPVDVKSLQHAELIVIAVIVAASSVLDMSERLQCAVGFVNFDSTTVIATFLFSLS